MPSRFLGKALMYFLFWRGLKQRAWHRIGGEGGGWDLGENLYEYVD